MLRILSILICLFFSFNILAQEGPMPQAPEGSETKSASDDSKAKKDIDQHKKVIEEYKEYLATIPEPVRDEIREYRKEVIKLNKLKISLYKKLSQEAQEFLNKERNFKKRLPFKERKAIK